MAEPLHFPELRTVADTTAFHAARIPQHPALECEGRVVSYAELDARANAVAHALLAGGVRPGSRVGYLGQESEHYYEILFGCAKSGAVLVPINWRLTTPEVDHILRDSQTEVLFCEPAFADRLPDRSALPRLHTLVPVAAPGSPDAGQLATGSLAPGDPATGYLQWRAGHPGTAAGVKVGPEDPVAQLYTSGTTGLPKGVVLAHRSFFEVARALAGEGLRWIDWVPGDRSLVGIPGFHIGGLWWSLQGFNAGVTNLVMRRFTSPDAVRLIRDRGASTACLVPAMLQMVLAEPDVTSADFATLRKVVYGGSPISESLLTRGLELLGCDFAQIYGLTETGNTAVCLPPDQHRPGSPRLKAAGRPYPGFEARVVGQDGRDLAPTEIGEVLLRTPAAMLQYWGLPEATASTLVDGWIHTGDAGYLDDEGYVYVCDRIKDTVIVAGENVYPAEIEKALCGHPAVADAAVVGIPHERWGEAVHAFVVYRPGQQVSPRQLMLSLRGTLADFKIPTSYQVIDAIPRNPSGKTLRRTLREPFWAGRSRRVN